MSRCVGGLILAVVALCGCGGGDGVQRHQLSGSVTFDGHPLPFGEAVFRPQTGPEGSATIRNGQFDTTADGGRDVIHGPTTIYVTGYSEEPAGSDGDETAEAEAAPPLFVGYEVTADLSSDTLDITIPGDASGYGTAKQVQRSEANEP
ncbi:MAG: hypothetical protein KDA89_19505 [Planctomycetaceae bacterium]|nr:hypothetical protein [Planctomycetaceae bacterium]